MPDKTEKKEKILFLLFRLCRIANSSGVIASCGQVRQLTFHSPLHGMGMAGQGRVPDDSPGRVTH